MIAIEVASPFLIPFKLALVLAIFICVPFLLYQLWAFIAPGLYRHERRLALPVLFSSTLLFYLGGLFAYFVVFPLVFAFLTASAPEGVAVMTDIGKYLDFVLTLFFAFGVAFEVPVVTYVLVWMGVTTPQALAEKRPYVIVGAFVIGMLLTPPDVISQTLLALPMWLLFELGVFMARNFVPKKAEGDVVTGHGEYNPPTEAEMEAELDRIEAEERKESSTAGPEFIERLGRRAPKGSERSGLACGRIRHRPGVVMLTRFVRLLILIWFAICACRRCAAHQSDGRTGLAISHDACR
jgi:sec-independent protein translocase protein TatC